MMTLRSTLRTLVTTPLLVLLVGVGSAWGAVTPSFSATASPSAPVGLQIFDHTSLMTSATGTITFRLYAPGDTTCQSPVFTSTVTVSGTGSDNSEKYNTRAAGTYQWLASYSGDANDNPISSVCGQPSQSVIINKAFPVGSVTAATNGSGQIHGTASLQGGFAPLTGTVTFTVTGPADTWCSGTQVYTRTVPVNGAGTYDSGWYTPTTAGTYTYRIRYAGDANNNGVGPTPCMSQNNSIALTQSQIAPPPPAPAPAPARSGGSGAAPVGSSSPTATTTPATPVAAGPVFHGPTRCVRGPFTVYVSGGPVLRVSYFLRGKRLRTVSRPDGHGRFAATLRASAMRRGSHQRLTARVATSAGVEVLHRTVDICV
jgi:hypothetical protein